VGCKPRQLADRYKGKVVPVLLTKQDAMKAYGVSGLIYPRFLDHDTGWR
jgi:hypothetical protein